MAQLHPSVVSQSRHVPTTSGQDPLPRVQQNQEQRSHYDPPIKVTIMGQLPTYGTAVYDYGPKDEYEDPRLQLLSSRLTSM
jgi:metal regulatory transcription factor 1